MSILNLVRPDLLSSENYIPGGENMKYRLHANESPSAPITFESIDLNFYPDSRPLRQLQEQLAARYQVDSNQLVLTRGSDDGIDLLTRLFLNGGEDALMQFPPTFPMYAFYVRLQQSKMIQCPLDHLNGFSLNLDQVNKYWQPNCKIIMFCSPNNPTANLIDLDLIARVCEQYTDKSVVVVDEAYIEFAKAQSATSLISQFENLIVLRTMSKAYGLAGLRLGCVIAQPHVILALDKVIAPYILSSAVVALANQALAKSDWLSTTIERNQEARAWLVKELQLLPIIEEIYPSESNFLLIKSSSAIELKHWLAEEHIAVRDFPPTSLLHHHLRITVGDEKQNQLLIRTLSSFKK